MAQKTHIGRRMVHISRHSSKTPLTITANGVYTAEGGGGYSPITVELPDGGVTTEEITIEENGEYEAPPGKAWRKIIINVPQGEIVKPAVGLSLNKELCYDPYDTSLDSVTITMNVTKGTNPLKDLKLYVDNVLIHTVENVVAGSVSYTYTPETPIKKTITFKAVVSDKNDATGTSSKTITFVGKTFYGVLGPDVTTPTEAQILGLSKVQKAAKTYTYSNINTDYGKIVYAFPTSMGALSKIMDSINNFNVTDSFSVKSVAVNGTLYYVYIQTDPSAAEGVTLTFS